MNRFLIPAAFAVGLMVVIWVGMGFVGTSWLALLMTVAALWNGFAWAKRRRLGH